MRISVVVALTLLMAGSVHALELGIASVDDGNSTPYDDGNYHHRTATGAMFNPNSMTAAHRTLPFGTIVQVTNLKSGERVYLKINDRGPCLSAYCQKRRPDLLKRIIDLTPYAADELGLEGLGRVAVRVCEMHGALKVCR